MVRILRMIGIAINVIAIEYRYSYMTDLIKLFFKSNIFRVNDKLYSNIVPKVFWKIVVCDFYETLSSK